MSAQNAFGSEEDRSSSNLSHSPSPSHSVRVKKKGDSGEKGCGVCDLGLEDPRVTHSLL